MIQSSKCNVWFDEPSRKRNRDVDREWLVGRIRDKVKRAKTLHPNLQEASGIPSDEELKEAERSEIAAFKRIRFDTRLPTFKMNRDQILYSHVQPSKLLEEEEMRKFYLQMNKHLESLRHEMPQQFLSSSLFTRDAPRG